MEANNYKLDLHIQGLTEEQMGYILVDILDKVIKCGGRLSGEYKPSDVIVSTLYKADNGNIYAAMVNIDKTFDLEAYEELEDGHLDAGMFLSPIIEYGVT